MSRRPNHLFTSSPPHPLTSHLSARKEPSVDTILLAGSAKVNITPPLTIPYLGYEPRHAFFHGVHDPLYARAAALDDGTTALLIIAADSIGYSNALLGPERNFT